MSHPAAPIVGGPPERIAAIQQRFAPLRSSSTSPTAPGDFEALLETESARLALGSAATADPTTALLPLTAGPPLADPAAPIGDAAPTSGTGSTSTPTGQAVVDAAKVHLGVPYLWGGTDPDRGFDCSGLVQAAYRDIGIEMPKWSRHQATMGVEVGSIDEALPGDVIAFGEPVDHVGIYVGDGKMIQAPRRGDVVRISGISRPITTIRRIITPGAVVPDGEPLTAAAGETVGAVPALTDLAVAGPTIDLHDPTGGPGSTGDWARSETERQLVSLFLQAGTDHGIDPTLLAAVAATESGFDPAAVSPAGAQGLMQFMPATARSMGVDPWDAASAIDGAARYLRSGLDRFGSTELALASYNAGPGAVARYGGIPPYRETQNYVRKVLAAWKERS
jgi:cell wall-associated NlpC family hydrolase